MVVLPGLSDDLRRLQKSVSLESRETQRPCGSYSRGRGPVSTCRTRRQRFGFEPSERPAHCSRTSNRHGLLERWAGEEWLIVNSRVARRRYKMSTFSVRVRRRTDSKIFVSVAERNGS